MFFNYIVSDPAYYITVILVAVVSIVLHELAHVFAALYEGDQTPRQEGYLTVDPFVLMGPISVLILCVVGLAWGSVPVRPGNFRHRYGEAIVAFAGPLMNLVLMLIAALALVITYRETGSTGGWGYVFQIAMTMNAILFILNMIPVPPFDGHTIVASFFPKTRPFYENIGAQGALIVLVLLMLPMREIGFPVDFGEIFYGSAMALSSTATTAWQVVF